MKSVLLSIESKYVELIASGKKTIKVCKSAPNEVPFNAYIYCLKGNDGYSQYGKVIGEFICNKVDEYFFSHYEAEYRVTHVDYEAMRINQPELIQYGKGDTLYGWHISDLKIYDKPKELSEFRKSGFMTEEDWLFNLYPNTHCHYESWAKKI